MRTFNSYFTIFILLMLGLTFCSATAQVSLGPVGLAVQVDPGDTLGTELVLTNAAEFDVNYKIDLREVDFGRFNAAYSNSNNGRNPIPARDRRGEPDDAGYYWIENNEQDGPRFDWVDLPNRQGARRLNAQDNFNSGVLELGFEFPWYGQWYNSIRVCENGWFTFDPEQNGTFSSVPQMPHRDAPNNILAVDLQDFTIGNNSSMWFWTDGEGVAVVSWVTMYTPIGVIRQDINFQAVLYAETGTVVYQYNLQTGLPGNLVNVGYENQDGTLGASIYYQSAVVQGLAIAITGPFSKWLIVEPRTGVVEAQSDRTLYATFMPGDIEPGTYEMRIQVSLDNPEEQGVEPDPAFIEISAVMTVDEPVADIAGVVRNAYSGEPVAGVNVALDRFIYARQSDDNGNYVLENLPRGNYVLTFTAPDFLTRTEEVQVDEEGEIELGIELLHATCSPNVEELFTQLEPDNETDLTFAVVNNGNGPLTYRTERRLIGDANAEPWTIRRGYNVGQVLNDDRLEGAVFDGERFYVCGAAGNEPNTIYILNRDGELVDQFDQPGNSVYGMKDLEWDGELIWGSGERRVYGFTTEGEARVAFDGPYNPNSAIAYDSGNDLLWVCATTNDLVAYDREGNRIQRTLSRCGLRIYGLAYWQDDPDGYPLYAFNSPEANVVRMHKMNPEQNGDTLFVRQLYTEGNVAPGGAAITNQYDVYSWVMIAIANTPRNNGNDRIDIFQLDARKDWFSLEPVSGIINAGEEQEFTLHLNATGLPTVTFEGELAFYHDGVGSLTRIPVTLDVVEGRVETFRDISLAQGWNLVSTNLQPEDEDVAVITRPLVDAGILQLMKNGFGQFYAPAVGFNNIPGWFAPQGYWMKLTEAAVLRVTGESMLPDDPIELARGWNLISYYPRRAVEAPTALSGIVDHLLIAKDGFGSFYVPAWGFNNMAPMAEGRGYQLKVDEDTELVYQTGQLAQSVSTPNNAEVTKFNSYNNTGRNMSLLLLTDKSLEGFVKVFAGSRQVGLGYAKDGFCGIAVWGDDPMTDEIDGAVEGEELQIENCKLQSVVYATDGFEVIDVKVGLETSPTRFDLTSVYPNPFNSTTKIGYGLPEKSDILIQVYDISGRNVATLINEAQTPGYHSIIWNAQEMSTGIYFVRMEAGPFRAVQKVVLVK